MGRRCAVCKKMPLAPLRPDGIMRLSTVASLQQLNWQYQFTDWPNGRLYINKEWHSFEYGLFAELNDEVLVPVYLKFSRYTHHKNPGMRTKVYVDICLITHLSCPTALNKFNATQHL